MKDWVYDADYISYIESGESAAVFIVRDVVKAIETDGRWVDVLSISTYYKRFAGNRKAFNWIVVELFSRMTQPEYIPGDDAYNKYITWATAHSDIDEQRSFGYSGEKYVVLCDLCEGDDLKWEYKIRAVRKINYRQAQYIIDNEWELEERIRENGRPTLEILGL